MQSKLIMDLWALLFVFFQLNVMQYEICAYIPKIDPNFIFEYITNQFSKKNFEEQ